MQGTPNSRCYAGRAADYRADRTARVGLLGRGSSSHHTCSIGASGDRHLSSAANDKLVR